MHSTVFGFRVNLIYIAILVAFYDLAHIVHELKERFELFWMYEDYDDGCLSNLFQTHCKFIYTEVSIYILDFIFTCFLIFGASSVSFERSWVVNYYKISLFQMKTIPVLAWLVLSAYHLIDFLVIFTPLVGTPYAFDVISPILWLDLSKFKFSRIKTFFSRNFKVAACWDFVTWFTSTKNLSK